MTAMTEVRMSELRTGDLVTWSAGHTVERVLWTSRDGLHNDSLIALRFKMISSRNSVLNVGSVRDGIFSGNQHVTRIDPVRPPKRLRERAYRVQVRPKLKHKALVYRDKDRWSKHTWVAECEVCHFYTDAFTWHGAFEMGLWHADPEALRKHRETNRI